MILLLDIGNTNTHAGLASSRRIGLTQDFPIKVWSSREEGLRLRRFIRANGGPLDGLVFSSVVPGLVGKAERLAKELGVRSRRLTVRQQSTLKIKYRTPHTLGTDRLANAMAAFRIYGGPVISIGCGTAVVVDVVDGEGCYRGGIIGPGIAMFRDYLHEKTAQLPAVRLRGWKRIIGRSTQESLLSGCVLGFEAMMSGLVQGVKRELGGRNIRVVANGGYAHLLKKRLSELVVTRRPLTLEGLRIHWFEQESRGGRRAPMLTR